MAKDFKVYDESNLTNADRWEITVRYLRFYINKTLFLILSAQEQGKNINDKYVQRRVYRLSTLKAFLKCIDTDNELINSLHEMEEDPETYEALMEIGYDKQ